MYIRNILIIAAILFVCTSSIAAAQMSPILDVSLDKATYEKLENVTLNINLESSQLGNVVGEGDLNFFRLDVAIKDASGKVCGFLFYQEPVWYSLVVKNFTFATVPKDCKVGSVSVTVSTKEGAPLGSIDLPVRVTGTSFSLTPVQLQVVVGILLALGTILYLWKREQKELI